MVRCILLNNITEHLISTHFHMIRLFQFIAHLNDDSVAYISKATDRQSAQGTHSLTTQFKVLLTTLKSLHCMAPLYISELLTSYSTHRSLGSVAVPQSWLRRKRDVLSLFWNKLSLPI